MGSVGASKNIASANTIPALNSELVRRANEAGMAVDYGDATTREYNRNTDEIMNMEYLSSEEKQNAIKELHSLTEKQLTSEGNSKSPYSYGVGPARFNAQKIRANADKAVTAKADVDRYMNKLRDDQKKARVRIENQERAAAMKKALDEGALSFTYKGETWTRKTKRSKSFYSA